MSTAPSEYASFLVRLWRERSTDLGELGDDWHGEIEHIQTGQRSVLRTLDELPGQLRQQARDVEGREK